MPSTRSFMVRKAAVLGAGVMGAQIAAHLANADVETVLFDLPAKEGDPNGNVLKAIDNLRSSTRAACDKAQAGCIEPANYDQHLDIAEGLRPGHRGDRRAHGLEAATCTDKIAPTWASTRSSPATPPDCRSTHWRRRFRKICAIASAACTSSTRRATCTWWN